MARLLLLMLFLGLPHIAHAFMEAGEASREGPATSGKGPERSGLRAVKQAQLLPPRLPDTDKEQISLVQTRLKVTIRHGIAVCRLVQVFQNNTSRVLEGLYRLPLPAGAEVNGFAVWDEGIKLVGEIMPRPRARAIYQQERQRLREKIRRQERLKDPGMLTRDRSKACTIRVFPTPDKPVMRTALAVDLIMFRIGLMASSMLSFWPFPDGSVAVTPGAEISVSSAS